MPRSCRVTLGLEGGSKPEPFLATWAGGISATFQPDFGDVYFCRFYVALNLGCSNCFGVLLRAWVERPFCNPTLVGETFHIL